VTVSIGTQTHIRLWWRWGDSNSRPEHVSFYFIQSYYFIATINISTNKVSVTPNPNPITKYVCNSVSPGINIIQQIRYRIQPLLQIRM